MRCISLLCLPLWLGCLADRGRESDATLAPADIYEATEVERTEVVAPEVAAPEVVDPGIDYPSAADELSLHIDAHEVAPQTQVVLHVEGVEALAAEQIVWAVRTPLSNVDVWLGTGASLTYEANLVGDHRFTVTITDGSGEVVRMSQHLMVVAGIGLHVELSWTTAGDPNEQDASLSYDLWSAGSDVDLHFVASGGALFGAKDTFFANPNPELGVFGAIDNPKLDRDDTDGAGPEITSVDVPAPGVSMVAVHYYDDWGYGDSVARVRIFWNGVVLDDWGGVAITIGDLWRSHLVNVTSGGEVTVERIGDAPDVIANFDYDPSVEPDYLIAARDAVALDTSTTLQVVAAEGQGAVQRVTWSVEPPERAAALVANEDGLTAVLTPTEAGRYRVTATVVLADARERRLTKDVIAAATSGLRIELTWVTPGDPDETDIAPQKTRQAIGSDLDLYLMRGAASGIADPLWSCGYHNTRPIWGAYPSAESPRLVYDDYDGGGPERIELAALEAGAPYAVAVHYYSDNGFGNAFATLRVFFGPTLAAEWQHVELVSGQTWQAFDIVDDTVTTIGSEPTIEGP